MPPSTVSITPVMYAAAGETRKAAARANSSGLAMRPSGAKEISYNVATWETAGAPAQAELKTVKRSNAQGGDGFDDRILDGSTKSRTANLFASAPAVTLRAQAWEQTAAGIRYTFAENADFALTATVTLPATESCGRL